jgi:hypothetical protein
VEPLFDVDVEEDLQLLSALCRDHPDAAAATTVALQELGLDMSDLRRT